MALDPLQDLGAVHLAQGDLGDPHGGRRPRHPPAVGVEHGQRVEVDVAVRDPGVPTEDRRVDPAVPVGQLDALRTGGGPRRVVDGGRGRLVGLPRLGLHPGYEQLGVRGPAEDEPPFGPEAVQGLVELGVDQQGGCARVLEDVLDLGPGQAEIDGHEDASPAAHAEERGEEAGRIVGDDGDALTGSDAEPVEPGRLGPGPLGQIGEGERRPRFGRLVRLVDDGHPFRVRGRRPVEESPDVELHLHGFPLMPDRPPIYARPGRDGEGADRGWAQRPACPARR